MKLSESFIKRATSVAEHVGEDFGILPDVVIPANASHYFTSHCVIETQQIYDFAIFAYSLWIDSRFFYFCINSTIYQCKRSLHGVFGIEEMAAFLYLVFCKHQTFNL